MKILRKFFNCILSCSLIRRQLSKRKSLIICKNIKLIASCESSRSFGENTYVIVIKEILFKINFDQYFENIWLLYLLLFLYSNSN